MAYKQGLSDGFVAALNDLHAAPEGEWWRKMLADPDLFVAIRTEYLNVYYRGCSLAKIKPDKKKGVVLSTHYKYLLHPSLDDPYVKATAGGCYALDGLRDRAFIRSPESISELKRASKPYAGGEKDYVAGMLRKSETVLDVEVALSQDAEGESETAKAKRLDISALAGNAIYFFEAKLFSNSELRADTESEAVAAVLHQIETYETLLTQRQADILHGAKAASQNIKKLHGMRERRVATATKLLACGDELTVQTKPYLIVGSFDDDQKNGEAWMPHRTRLVKALGGRIILHSSGQVDVMKARRATK